MEVEKVKKAKKLKKEKRKRDSTNGHHKSSPRPASSSKSSKRTKRTKVEFASSVKEELYNPTKPSKPSIPVKSLVDGSITSSQYDNLKVQVTNPSSTEDPIIVSFPSGLPSSLINQGNKSLKDGDDDYSQNGEASTKNSTDRPVFTWHNSRAGSSRGRQLYGEDSTCSYTAMNLGRGYDNRRTKIYVAVYHKPSKTVRMVPASERGTVFALDQGVTSYQEDAKGMFDSRKLSLAERRRLAFEAFGSSKKKKVLRSQDANVVEMRSVVGAGDGMRIALGNQLDKSKGLVSESNAKIMEEIRQGKDTNGKIMTAIEVSHAQARRGFLPPFDESADKPFRVYDAQEVAEEEAWSQISRTTTACLHKDDWKEALQSRSPWNSSTKKILEMIDCNKKGSKYLIKTILLVEHMIRFHNRASKSFLDGSLEDISKYLNLPFDVANRFLTLFCVPAHDRGRAGFATSKQLKDKRVVYTLVMYLLAHGKEMKIASVKEICDDLRLPIKDCMMLYREAGCKCVKSKDGTVSVKLQVPLLFPGPKRGKKVG